MQKVAITIEKPEITTATEAVIDQRPQPQRVAGKTCQIQLNALKASYEQKLASFRKAPANNQQVINLNSLHSLEQMNVRLACTSVSGAANYNRCIQQQVQALQSAPRLR